MSRVPRAETAALMRAMVLIVANPDQAFRLTDHVEAAIKDIGCYPGPHGIERSGKRGDGKPAQVGNVLELAPSGRTGDWRDK